MLDRPHVFLDLETTGATAALDRITEVGLVEVGADGSPREWTTLVNPQTAISPFIESLTGISNAMVAEAPPFADIAAGLHARLEGKVLVAHSARFDYGFLRQEFARLDIRYYAPTVCTVKLSRKLYPGHPRHNLDALMERHGITCAARHRALGDARVLWDLFATWRGELGDAAIECAAGAQLHGPALPPGLLAGLSVHDIPEAPGVHVFYAASGEALRVARSANLRTGITAYFARKRSRDAATAQQVCRVEWHETCGMSGAMLEELRLLRTLRPRLEPTAALAAEVCSLHWQPGTGMPVTIVDADAVDFTASSGHYGLFRSRRAALDRLRKLARAYELCLIGCGLEPHAAACSALAGDACRGVCAGLEPSVRHDLRLMSALAALRLPPWPFRGRIGVRPRGSGGTLHILDRWRYWGTLDAGGNTGDAGCAPVFDIGVYTMLQKLLHEPAGAFEIVPLPAWQT